MVCISTILRGFCVSLFMQQHPLIICFLQDNIFRESMLSSHDWETDDLYFGVRRHQLNGGELSF